MLPLLALLVGVLLGPASGVVGDAGLRALAPLTALAVGWLGADLGGRLAWRALRRYPRPLWSQAALQAGAVLLAVGGAAAALALLVPPLRAAWRPLVPAVLILAAIGVMSRPRAVPQPQEGGSQTARGRRRAATLDALIGTAAFALALAWAHPLGPAAGPLGAVLWVGLALGTAALTAGVWVVAARLVEPGALGAVAPGAILLGAGVAYAAGLSPFVVCAGAAALVTRTRQRRALAARLAVWRAPAVAAVLVFAGALLAIRTPWLLAAALVLAAARFGGRWAAAVVGARRARVAPPGPAALVEGLAQGALVLALGLDVLLLYRGTGAGAALGVLATVLLAAVYSQLAAAAPWRPRRTRELTASPAPAEVS